MKRREIVSSVESMVEEFLGNCRMKGLSERTIGSYTKTLKYILPIELTEESIQKTVVDIVSKDIAVASKNSYLRTLKVFCNWATDNGYIPEQKISAVRGQKPSMRIYSDEDVKTMLELHKHPTFAEQRTHAIISLVVSTGARANTIVNIKLKDIDWSGKTILFSCLKNKSTATMPMSNQLEKVLRSYINTWELPENGFLFCNDEGEQLDYYGLRSACQRYIEAKGIKYIGVHSLRHFFATTMARNGVSVYVLQRLLSHSSISVTQQYIHMTDRDIRTEYNPLDAITKTTKIQKRCN